MSFAPRECGTWPTETAVLGSVISTKRVPVDSPMIAYSRPDAETYPQQSIALLAWNSCNEKWR
jgi:hypothetical protein